MSKDILLVVKEYNTATKRKEYFLYDSNNINNKYCIVCCKEKEHTTKHHLIPRRALSKHNVIKRLIVHVCDKCDEKIHPEHIDEEYIIKRQNKKIQELRNTILTYKDDKFIEILKKRITNLERDVKKVHKELQLQPKKIYPVQKMFEGRITELKKIIGLYRKTRIKL